MLLRLGITSVLGSVIQSATAVPVQSREVVTGSDPTLRTATFGAYSKFLQSQGLANAALQVLPIEENISTFSGSPNSTVANQAIFSAADTVGDWSFSSQYSDFLKDLGSMLAGRPNPSQNETKLATDADNACYVNLTRVAQPTFAVYKQKGGTGNIQSKAFSEFAHNDTGIQAVIQTCNDTMQAYHSLHDKTYGANDYMIEPALMACFSTQSPGKWSPALGNQCAMNITANGTTVPYYALPSLDSTVAGWKASSDASPAFTWSSGSDTLSFGGIGLIDVQRGAWFDNFLSAKATQNPGSAPLAAQETALFAKYFGTAQQPGSLAKYNDKMLVAYKAKAVLSFSGQAPSMTASVGGMWGGVLGTASSDGKVTLESNSTDPFLIGFVVHNYWDASSPSSNSTSSSTST
ncbi:hypothetical protein DFH06DRAFT_1473852 [Mycena polygramma]|nr:hypothetical protein DFH06DRAFT_1473852 [Mycena polygramma]